MGNPRGSRGPGAWALAWTRFDWFAPFQEHTFTPLWLAYIVVVNAACVARTGGSPLIDRPGLLIGLFPASALFWWFFEMPLLGYAGYLPFGLVCAAVAALVEGFIGDRRRAESARRNACAAHARALDLD